MNETNLAKFRTGLHQPEYGEYVGYSGSCQSEKTVI